MFNKDFDIKAFARDGLGVDLIDPQIEALENIINNKSTVTVGCRGFGKDFLMSVIAVTAAAFHESIRVGIFAPSFRQAKSVFIEIEKLHKTSKLLRYLSGPVAITDDLCSLDLYNGSTIKSFPVGDASKLEGRGFINILLVNEACHLPEDVFSMALCPMSATCISPIEVMKVEKLKEDIKDTKYISDRLLRQAVLTDISKTQEELLPPSRIALFTPAYYRSSWVYKLIQSGSYSTTSFSYKDIPKGFIDLIALAQASRDMTPSQFCMDYESEWVV